MNLQILSSSMTDTFNQHRLKWRDCVKCEIGMLAHHKVFVRGTIPADILFVGEAPGVTEDATGWPFVGRSGRLLDQWISNLSVIRAKECGSSMPMMDLHIKSFAPAISKVSFAVTNIVLCRPTNKIGGGNREPSPAEIGNCNTRLVEIYTMVQPRAVVTLGRFAMMNMPYTMEDGKQQVPRLHLLHPAYVLRKAGYGKEIPTKQKDLHSIDVQERNKLAAFVSNVLN